MVWMLLPVLCVFGQANTEEPLLLANEFAELRVWPAQGRFDLRDTASGQTVIEHAVLNGGGGAPVPFHTELPGFGQGNGIEIAQASGGRCRLTLFSGSPFVHLQCGIAQAPDTPLTRLGFLEGRLNLGSTGSLKALGTAGLTAPDAHPGSYSFLAIAHPGTRAGIVAGWVSHDRGSGALFSSMENGQVVLRARIDYGGLTTGGDSELLVLGFFDDARLGLEAYADLVAGYYRISLPPIPSGYCTWYSNPHGGASDERHIIELAQFAKEHLKPFGFDFIQIDDMWQGRGRNARELDLRDVTEDYLGKRPDLPLQQDRIWWWGPDADFTAHAPDGPYAGGMRPVAGQLSALGFMPGLWLMPFAWDPMAPPLRNHHDWFVKRPGGSLHYAYWAGWSLDMTHPQARDFLREAVDRITNEWGYRYLKLDALFSGMACEQLYINDPYLEDDLGEAVFHDEHQTPIEAYRRGLRTVREAAAKDTFILGCNVSQNMRTLGASYGLVDAMRIGPDNGPELPEAVRIGEQVLPLHRGRRVVAPRFAQCLDRIGLLERGNAAPVADELVRGELHGREVTPPVGIPDVAHDGVQFRDGLPAGRLVHPLARRRTDGRIRCSRSSSRGHLRRRPPCKCSGDSRMRPPPESHHCWIRGR